MPHVQRFQREYGNEGLIVLSIGFVSNPKLVKKTMDEGLKMEESLFPVLLDGWKVYKDYKGKGTPNTYIIDRDGNIRFIHRNFNWSMAKTLELEIEFLIKEDV